jgi:heme/copper-type cytochrome/quinol oxidase subunit 2
VTGKEKVWRGLLSPWIILLFLVIGWGPLFLADLVRYVRPDLNASYTPQAFAMGWLMITLWCSVLAIVLAVVHSVWLIMMTIRGSAKRRRDQPPRG